VIIATVRLHPRGGTAAAIDRDAVLDALWVHARPDERIEHIYVGGSDPIGIAVFFAGTDQAAGQATAARLCARMLAANRGWRRAFHLPPD
jgi:hypothetical protein